MKPLLVGESNPYSLDPAMALFPLPEHASGGRLARILGLSRPAYLRTFDRLNLCVGPWDAGHAARRASEILHDCERSAVRRPLVLLGRRVAAAFGAANVPAFGAALVPGARLYLLPHPSARCRTWNEPNARRRVRQLLAEFLPP